MSEKELIEKDLQEAAQRQEQELLKNLEQYHFLRDNGYILFETITGSQAHGTSTPSSDIDKAFVYILPQEDILGIKYKEQLKIHKDFMGYEIRRFLELLKKGNPTILELLNSPEDCVLLKHQAFDILLNQKEKFVTKVCENAFYGYAKQQRQKAEGLEKLQNWEIQRITKKGPFDFCYVIVGYDAVPARKWLEERGLDQLFCALTSVTHCRDLFAVFYDYEAHAAFSERVPLEDRKSYKAEKKAMGETMGLGYKGIAFEDSNDIRLSNIPIEERNNSICHLSYNKDGYRKHCDDYKRYQTWVEERNEKRWVEIKGHGQQIDGKNMMHFMRLVLIGREIAQRKGIQIRRPDAQELLKIRRGEVSLRELFDKSDAILSEMKTLFQNSELPDEVSDEVVHNMLIDIRGYFYSYVETNVYGANHEEKNNFMINNFGNYSELHHIIRCEIDKYIGVVYNGDLNNFLDEENAAIIMNGFIANANTYPKTRNADTGKAERVDIENFAILEVGRNKITVLAGGDWQEPIKFDIVVWQDTLAAINIVPVIEWSGVEVDPKYFYKQLGYKRDEK